MSTSREKMQQAKELIEAKRYDEARALLRTINHDMALDWLDKIDKLNAPKIKHIDDIAGSPESSFTSAIKPKRKQRPLLALLLLVLAVIILAVGVAYYQYVTKPASDALGQSVTDIDNYYATKEAQLKLGTTAP